MAAKWWDKILNGLGLKRISNSIEGSGPLTAASFWEWVMAPMSGSLSMDTELRVRLPFLRREARKLAFNNPIISQYLELLRDNVIGPHGMKLQAQIKNSNGKLNKLFCDRIEAGWADFWSDPWVDGKMDGVSGEQLLIQNCAIDGEFFVRIITAPWAKYGIKLQMLVPDQIDTNCNRPAGAEGNEIRLGVEIDGWGRPVAYHCYTSDPTDISGSGRQLVRIAAEDIIHFYDPERIGQSRGYTWFSTVMQNLRNLDGYVEAAILAARTAACAVPIFKMTTDFGVDEKAGNYKVNMEPGKGITIPAGLELQEWNPNHPHTNHGEFIKGNLRFSSSGLHVSYNALANDLEGVNYSSMRSGLLIERDGWRTLQRLWISQFRQRVYQRWLWGALLTGELVLDSRDPKKFHAVTWVPRGWAWVDPLKDMTAAILGIENRLGSRTAYLAEQGNDYETVCDQLAAENDISAASGLPNQTPAEQQPPGKKAALRLAVVNMLLDENSDIDPERLRALMKGSNHG